MGAGHFRHISEGRFPGRRFSRGIDLVHKMRPSYVQLLLIPARAEILSLADFKEKKIGFNSKESVL